MGTGSSKSRKANSASSKPTLNGKSNLSLNQRSSSVPSYASSLENSKSKRSDLPDHSLKKLSSSSTSQNGQRVSEPALKNSNSLFNTVGMENEICWPQNVSFPNPKPLVLKADANNESSLTTLELYNILIAETWQRDLHLVENTYLLLLDCRDEDAYLHCHIITARHVSCLEKEYGCLLDVPGQLEAFELIVLYGNKDKELFSSLQKRNSSVFYLDSNFFTFQDKHPFLCTDSLYKTVNERKLNLKTWPSEIIEGKLFQGNASHAMDNNILQTLGITHVLNITLDKPNAFPQTINYMRIQLDDEVYVDLYSWLKKTTKFIQDALNPSRESDSDVIAKKNRVLVHCNYGRSRSSTVVLAYLMESFHWSLRDACDWLKDCRPTVKPNVGFLNQLLLYEKKVFGREVSDFHQLPF